MKLTRSLALPLAALAVIGSGLTIGAALPEPAPAQGIGTPTPCAEDSPCWDCSLMGNHICGPLTEAERATGWAVWDQGQGSRKLRVDPSRAFRVDYLGTATLPPSLDTYDLALPGRDGKWHVFRPVYTG